MASYVSVVDVCSCMNADNERLKEDKQKMEEIIASSTEAQHCSLAQL